MKNNNVFYMQLAYKASLIAMLNNNIPVGAVITDKNNIIFTNFNSNSKEKNVFEHAEIKCLRNIQGISLTKKQLFLYSTLVCCPACSGHLYMSNIKNIYFGCENNNSDYNDISYKILKKNLKNGFLKKRCSNILSVFFKIRRKLFPGK